MSHLDEKRSALAEVQGKLQALNNDYDRKITKKKVGNKPTNIQPLSVFARKGTGATCILSSSF